MWLQPNIRVVTVVCDSGTGHGGNGETETLG